MTTTTATRDWLAEDRAKARSAFDSTPVPLKTSESWRRTPFAEFALDRLGDLASKGSWLLDAAPSKATVSPLEAAALERPELVHPLFEGSWAGEEHVKLERLNRALWSGAFVYVPKGVRLEQPIRLPYESKGGFAFPRLLVVLDEGAEATIIEAHRGEPAVSIACSKIVLGRSARAHVVYQQELGPAARSFWSQKCVLAEGAQLTHTSLVLGSGVHKGDLEIELAGAGSRSELFGMTLGRDKQHFDIYTKQWHRAPRTSSDLTFRSALRDRSRSVYTGLIRIEEEARGTEAFQSDHNLLLSGQARADSTPILEILTDDVACKHAATAGQLDADELFYLAARCLPEAEAKRLLIMGFFEPVLKRLPLESERERLGAQIEAEL